MNIYDASEQAFRNGEKRGIEQGLAAGYEQGFADGLAAAGIAPIQWRDARVLPFTPEDGRDYLVTLPWGGRPVLWGDPALRVIGVEPDAVAFWCPVDLP